MVKSAFEISIDDFLRDGRLAERQHNRRIFKHLVRHGTAMQRLAYCVERATLPIHLRVVVYGTAVYDEAAVSKTACRWFVRMERAAQSLKRKNAPA